MKQKVWRMVVCVLISLVGQVLIGGIALYASVPPPPLAYDIAMMTLGGMVTLVAPEWGKP